MSEQDGAKRDEPDEPTGILNEQLMSPLDSMTVQLNEVYESLKRAGFTPPEAITMVTGLLSGMLQYSPLAPGLDEFDDNDNNDEEDEDDDDDFWDGLEDRL